jgi:hypothetical protein
VENQVASITASMLAPPHFTEMAAPCGSGALVSEWNW